MQNFWLRSPLEASKRVNVKEMDLNQLVAVGGTSWGQFEQQAGGHREKRRAGENEPLCLKLAVSYLPPLSWDKKVRRLCAFSSAARPWLNHTFLFWTWCNMIFTKDANLTKPFGDLSKNKYPFLVPPFSCFVDVQKAHFVTEVGKALFVCFFIQEK